MEINLEQMTRRILNIPPGVKFEPVPVETCRTVFPKHDLGRWEEFGRTPMVVYATIERPGSSEVRALQTDGEDLFRHSIKELE